VSPVGQAVFWVLVALPATTGALLCLAGRRVERWAAGIAVVTAAAVLAAAITGAAVRPEVAVRFLPVADVGLAVDGLSAVVLPAVAAVTLLVLVFAAGDVREGRARFSGLMLLFAAAVAMTGTATTLPALLVAWEVMGATSYALIGHHWRRDATVAAGTTAFVTTRTADLGLYLAAGAAVAGGAGLSLDRLPDAAAPWADVAAAGVLVAALGKAAQLPFSFWLSRAMVGPSPVSALLHSAAMVAMGGYLLLRTAPLLESTGWAAHAAAWTGAVTAVALGAVAVAQRDLKQLLAASTSAQLGFVVLGAGVASVSGGAVHLVAHAATKATLFLAAGAWLTALGTRRLTALRGAARRWPAVGAAAGVAALSLAGVPPLALWATKDEVLAAAKETSTALYVVGLAAAALSAAYAGKVLWTVWRALPDDAEAGYDTEEAGTRRVGILERVPLVLLAAGAAVLGLLAWPPVGDALRTVLGETAAPRPGPAELLVSGALAVAVVAVMALAVRRGASEPRWATGWLFLDVAAERAVVRPVWWLAGRCARFDDAVLDRAVMATARAPLRAARWLAEADDRGLDAAVEASARAGTRLARRAQRADIGGIDRLVDGIATATRGLGAVVRRTQTGLLHHYYVQAAVVLAAALAVLLLAGR
jgi:NADH-quinone oxidoreductase subunit L